MIFNIKKKYIIENEYKNLKIYSPNYQDTKSFGWQWNKFHETQIDNNEQQFTKQRFFAEIGHKPEFFDYKNVLEVGSGAGRFTNVILNHTKCNLYSVDSSDSVFANYKLNSKYIDNRLFLSMSSIYDLPFQKEKFDIVICFGVLQHTKYFEKSVKCLIDQIKPGGHLFIDFYPINGWWTKIHSKYFFRRFTKKMNKEKLLEIIDKYLDFGIFIYNTFSKFKLNFLTRFLPIADIKNAIPNGLPEAQRREMILLDTFDMLSPKYDNPQKISHVKKICSNNNISVKFSGYVKFENLKAAVIRGVKL